MPLQPVFFQLFAYGFSYALLINQAVNLTSTSLTTYGKIIMISMHITFAINLPLAWLFFRKLPIPNLTFYTGISTVFANIITCGMVYISILRFNAFFSAKPIILKIGIPFVVIMLILRMVRSVLVFIANTGTVQSPIANLLNGITALPLLVTRMVLDIICVRKLWKMRLQGSQDKRRKIAFQRISISLSLEILYAIVTLAIIFLDTAGYKGNKPAYIDALLVSWTLTAMTEQKKLYQIIFATESTSEAALKDGKGNTEGSKGNAEASRGKTEGSKGNMERSKGNMERSKANPEGTQVEAEKVQGKNDVPKETNDQTTRFTGGTRFTMANQKTLFSNDDDSDHSL